MPFLKPVKESLSKLKIEPCKRNGWRHAIYGPHPKEIFQDHYKGQWKHDKRHGKGTEISRHGFLYEGDWYYGKKHGYGVLSRISKNGDIKKLYSGTWENGKKHGKGGHWYDDGSYYEGSFHLNKREGFGRVWYVNGSYYQGSWKNDRYHGKGMLIQENGNRYEGEFVDGKKEGRGIFYHVSTGQLQEGLWKDDLCISSTVEDVSWRQSVPYPTPFPIPKCELQNWKDIVDSVRGGESGVQYIQYSPDKIVCKCLSYGVNILKNYKEQLVVQNS